MSQTTIIGPAFARLDRLGFDELGFDTLNHRRGLTGRSDDVQEGAAQALR